MIHKLKISKDLMRDIEYGNKIFEYRLNDRDYKVGDSLHLIVFDYKLEVFTDYWIVRKITYIIHGGQFGIPNGYCIMSIK